jgi:hypothetical protein
MAAVSLRAVVRSFGLVPSPASPLSVPVGPRGLLASCPLAFPDAFGRGPHQP